MVMRLADFCVNVWVVRNAFVERLHIILDVAAERGVELE